MAKTFNSALEAVEHLTRIIETEGFDRFDSKYISNASFELSKGFSIAGLKLAKESTIDFEWSWGAAAGEHHPAPNGSYYKKRFGDEVRPYGDVWNISELVGRIKSPEQRRRAVLYNGPDACVMASQFWVEGDDLDMTVSLRSSDVSEMLHLDIQFFRLLHHKISELTGFTPGKTVYNLNNSHLLK